MSIMAVCCVMTVVEINMDNKGNDMSMMNNEVCKAGQVLMSANRVAEIYYKSSKLLDNDTLMVNRISNNNYVFSRREDVTNGRLQANKRPCIFYDEDTDTCKLVALKPDVCSLASNIAPTPMKDIIDCATFDKKASKKRKHRLKEDMILYMTIWHINRLVKEVDEGDTLDGVFEIERSYRLAKVDGGRISSIQFTKLIALDSNYEAVARIYNNVNRQLLLLPISYIQVLVRKLNGYLKGGNFNNCDMDLTVTEKSSVYLLGMFRLYANEYTGKSKEFTGIVKAMDTFKFLKDINEELGGNKSGSRFGREQIECIMDNNAQMYKIIMKND